MLFQDITMKENIYDLVEALENESEGGISDEDEILARVFEELEGLENGKKLKRDIRDVLELTSLNFFAKGMKIGARLYDLLMNSVCNSREGIL